MRALTDVSFSLYTMLNRSASRGYAKAGDRWSWCVRGKPGRDALAFLLYWQTCSQNVTLGKTCEARNGESRKNREKWSRTKRSVRMDGTFNTVEHGKSIKPKNYGREAIIAEIRQKVRGIVSVFFLYGDPG